MIEREYIGVGVIDRCRDILRNLSARSIFLVTGKDSYVKSGAEKYLQKILADYKVTVFNDFTAIANIEDIKRGIVLFRENVYDVVLAVGGGHVIDTAKMINFFAINSFDSIESVKIDAKSIEEPKPLIAVPTTAGSGSEATHFAVFYIGFQKYSVAHQYILPNASIIDPLLTMSLPKKITATSGMDALCQAIESCWSVNSTEESKVYAKEAIKLILSNLSTAVNNPTKESRRCMIEGAHLAGKAINISKTTASHAISYPLTSRFDIPHGHAVALTIPSLLSYNYYVTDSDLLDTRGCDYVRNTVKEIMHLLGARNIEDAQEKIMMLMRDIGLEIRLVKLGVNKEDIETIMEEAFSSDRVKSNPRKLTRPALREILRNIY